MTNPITIHLDPEVTAWVDEEAKRTNSTLETVIRQLINRAITMNQKPIIHHDLDHLAGTWSEADAAEFLEATSDFGRIDEDMWR